MLAAVARKARIASEDARLKEYFTAVLCCAVIVSDSER